MDKNEELLAAVDYAISRADAGLFDLMVGDFSGVDEATKKQIIRKVVMKSPNVEFIQHVLDFGFNVRFIDDNGDSLLHYAALCEHPETVRFFLSKGIPKDIENEWGETSLHVAARKGNSVAVLKAFLDAGCNQKVLSAYGEPLLNLAAGRNPNPEIAKFLLEYGFDVEERAVNEDTPLQTAARCQENIDVISLLLDSGANINAPSQRGNNLLHYSAMNENPEVARFASTIFSTSDLNQNGENAMDLVLSAGCSGEVLKILLKKQREEQAMKAACNCRPEILEGLIDCGYDSNITDANGRTLLMMAAYCNCNPEVIMMLRCYNASWKAVDNDDRNVLHYAAANENPEIYKWMIKDSELRTLGDRVDAKGHLPEYYRNHASEF